MLITTFKKHPLLSQLDYKKNKHFGGIFGLYEHDIVVSDEEQTYFIKERELKEVFINRCLDNDTESILIFLKFNYVQLSTLEENNPFHINNKLFLDEPFILSVINKLNYFDKEEASILLQKHIEKWLNKTINSDEDLLSHNVSDALFAVALYQPQLAFSRLNKVFAPAFEITKRIYEDSNYELLLYSLEEMATNIDYFEFSSRRLFLFSAQEVKLGIYHGAYKAFHRFNSLFRNACSRTRISLKERKKHLDKMIREAETKNDYHSLYILLKTLGIAANFSEPGEHEYIKDDFFENYINFCITTLMRYAGMDDENGLSYTAEEELHQLIKNTIDESEVWGANHVPFLIFRLFLEQGREWNQNPFYHLNDLASHIEFCKEDNSYDDTIRLLELRMKQLISLCGGGREFIAENFTLYLGAKHSKKICEIGIEVDPSSKIELHARQSLAERLIFSGSTNLYEISRSWPKCTYIVANFGMIITDRPHEEAAPHKRIFKTIPIKIPNYTITGREILNNGHAEEALYDYLLLDVNIMLCLNMFRSQFGINADDHKVYAIIIDLHGTYDMCVSCSNKGFEFQDKFREKLLKIFKDQKIKTLKKYPSQLPIIVRYSSDIKYHYPSASEDKKKGVLAIVVQEGASRDLSDSQKVNPQKYKMNRDMKFFGANTLIHGKGNWHLFWSKPKQDEYAGKSIQLESWTAFVSDNEARFLSEERKRTNYTHLGQVDTIDEATLKLSQLALK